MAYANNSGSACSIFQIIVNLENVVDDEKLLLGQIFLTFQQRVEKLILYKFKFKF